MEYFQGKLLVSGRGLYYPVICGDNNKPWNNDLYETTSIQWNVFFLSLLRWFQRFLSSLPRFSWGKWNPIWQAYGFNGLVQPPTSFFVIGETFQQRSSLGDLLTMLQSKVLPASSIISTPSKTFWTRSHGGGWKMIFQISIGWFLGSMLMVRGIPEFGEWFSHVFVWVKGWPEVV